MKNFILLLALTFILTSCGEKKPQTSETKITHVSKKSTDGLVKNVAQISVEGMMCEMACVEKVRAELAELECVTSVEIDFDTENPIDIATVEFDAQVCDENSMIEKIQSIGDGMYHVKSVEVQTYQ